MQEMSLKLGIFIVFPNYKVAGEGALKTLLYDKSWQPWLPVSGKNQKWNTF